MAEILVIEDEAPLRLNIVRLLIAEGYVATSAAGAQEALARVQERTPDLIISDVLLPGRDGFSLLQELRAQPALAGVPFIFLTGLQDREHFRRGMSLGADDYLHKPFRSDELLQAVQVRLARAQAARLREAERLGLRERQLQELFRRALLGQTYDKLALGEQPAAGGEPRRATVLFSDIRDFTTISERLSAPEVAELLNTYFSHVCEPIAAYGGRALKFIGDGVMAVFDGEGDSERPHQRRALLAALGMALQAQRFRAWLAGRFPGRGLPAFAIGIGVHEGEVVMGPLGPREGREYTAIGDTVNLASRLEGKTKELGWSVIASRGTLDAAGPGIAAGRSLTLWVKGRRAPVDAVEIIGVAVEPALEDTARLQVAGEIAEALRANSEVTARAVKSALEVTQGMRTAQYPQVKGYRVIRSLGRGGMSQVYLAQREGDGEHLVLKLMQPHPEIGEEVLSRFIQEYTLLAGIHHPNVVRIHDQAFSDDMAYIAMEYFAGGDLRAAMNRGMGLERSIDLVAQAASGLAEVHRRGIVHRDVKPDNLMLRADGTLALADFGIAKHPRRSLAATRHGEVLGTPYYMSPEQAAGRAATPRSDLYSLGVLAFELLTGSKPYRAASVEGLLAQHKEAPVPLLPQELRHWQPLIDGLMAKDPRQRFARAQEVLYYLGRVPTPREPMEVIA